MLAQLIDLSISYTITLQTIIARTPAASKSIIKMIPFLENKLKVQSDTPSNYADITATLLSLLCLAHCLILPFFVSTLPLFGSISENEMIHKGLVFIAIPVSLSVFFISSNAKRVTITSIALILAGCALLILGAFVEVFEAHETNLTVSGVILLSAAHISRMLSRHKA